METWKAESYSTTLSPVRIPSAIASSQCSISGAGDVGFGRTFGGKRGRLGLEHQTQLHGLEHRLPHPALAGDASDQLGVRRAP